jgi:hypothetical protein
LEKLELVSEAVAHVAWFEAMCMGINLFDLASGENNLLSPITASARNLAVSAPSPDGLAGDLYDFGHVRDCEEPLARDLNGHSMSGRFFLLYVT